MDEMQTLSNDQHKQADNEIDDGGARALSEALKTNATLKSLKLSCEQKMCGTWKKCRHYQTTNTNKQTTRLTTEEHEH